MDITICGAGWLGHPLAKHLQHSGHNIVATKRSEQGVNELLTQGIQSYQFELNGLADNDNALFQQRNVILNIPGGRRNIDAEQFAVSMISLIDRIFTAGANQLIFVSTSSVYGDNGDAVTEQSDCHPSTESAKAHVIIEKHISANYFDKSCILRLAGLVGGNRHPVKFLSGRSEIKNGQQRVNLVHRDDVIAAIERILKTGCNSEIFHLSASDHPRRNDYYPRMARISGLPEPEFVLSEQSACGKYLDCSYTLTTLGLELKYASVLDMVPEKQT